VPCFIEEDKVDIWTFARAGVVNATTFYKCTVAEDKGERTERFPFFFGTTLVFFDHLIPRTPSAELFPKRNFEMGKRRRDHNTVAFALDSVETLYDSSDGLPTIVMKQAMCGIMIPEWYMEVVEILFAHKGYSLYFCPSYSIIIG